MHPYRIRFGKHEPMRFTGHLDLQRTWERTFRRAHLPIKFTEGFHPRAKMLFAAALPLGFLSDCEYLDIWLDEQWPTDRVHQALTRAVPPGLIVYDVSDDKSVAKTPQPVAAHYEVELAATDQERVSQQVPQLLEATEIPRERNGKPYNLRPLIRNLTFDQNKLRMELVTTSNSVGRPDEVLRALDLDPNNYLFHRRTLLLESRP